MELDRADEVAPGPEGRTELDAASEETPLGFPRMAPTISDTGVSLLATGLSTESLELDKPGPSTEYSEAQSLVTPP